jgi:hypothetical protein
MNRLEKLVEGMDNLDLEPLVRLLDIHGVQNVLEGLEGIILRQDKAGSDPKKYEALAKELKKLGYEYRDLKLNLEPK